MWVSLFKKSKRTLLKNPYVHCCRFMQMSACFKNADDNYSCFAFDTV